VQQARQQGPDRTSLADVILKLAGEVRQQLTTTDTDLNATTPLLYELNERKPLALVK